MLTRPLYLLLRLIVPVSIAAITLLIGLAYIAMQPVLYESRAKVWIQAVDRVQMETALYHPLTTFFNNPIITSCELIKSDFVVRKACELLATKSPAEFSKIQPSNISKNLKADGIKQTDLVVISYSNNNPKTAAAVVQAVLDAFIAVNTGAGNDDLSRKLSYLHEQLTKAKQDYAASRKHLQEYKTLNKTVDVTQESNHTLQTIRDLDYSMNITRVEVAKSQSVISMLEDQLRGRSGAMSRIKAVINDSLCTALREKISENELKMIELKSKYQPGHVRMRTLQTAIEHTKNALSKRIEEITNRGGDENLADEATSGLITELAKAKAQLHAGQTAFEYQQQAMDAQKKRLANLPAHQEQLLELERAEQFQAGRVNDVQSKLEQAEISGSSSRPTNIQIVDYPQVPTVPTTSSFNQFMLVVAFAVLFAGIAFGGLLFLDPALDNLSFLRRVFNAPIFAGLRPLPASGHLPDDMHTVNLLRFALRPWITSRSKRIVVTSADVADGKSAIAAGLALAYARSGKKVALIDANFKKPSLHHLFKVNPGQGWYTVMNGLKPLEQTAIPVERNLVLFALPAEVDNLSGLFESQTFEDFVSTVEQEADVVVFDTPALLKAPETLAMLGSKCCMLIVVRYKHTMKRSLRLFASGMQHLSSAVKTAVVLNDVDEHALVPNTPHEEEVESDSTVEAVL
jgi:succinoglycan biosynthesis transport protein ExoP